MPAPFLAILVLAMAPASRAGTPSCPAGFEEFTEYRLFFGRSRGDVEVVSDKAWQGFLAAEITPRFPDGLTVLGRRRAVARRIRLRSCGRGRSLVIVLARPGAAEVRHTVEIAEEYKRSFGQEAVLRTIHAGLRVVLGLCTLPPRTRWSARARLKREW